MLDCNDAKIGLNLANFDINSMKTGGSPGSDSTLRSLEKSFQAKSTVN